jgi:hypothetical protein
MRSTLTMLVAIALFGCGGSESSTSPTDASIDSATTSDGSSSPDSRINPTSKCYFTGDLIVDGVTRGLRSDGCGIGSVTNGVVQVNLSELQGGERVQVSFYLDEPVSPGYVGAIRIKDVKVSIGSTALTRKWIGTSCTLTITRNEADPAWSDAGADAAPSWHLRAVGTGSCSAPFTPDMTTSTLSVGAYEVMFDATRNN